MLTHTDTRTLTSQQLLSGELQLITMVPEAYSRSWVFPVSDSMSYGSKNIRPSIHGYTFT